MSDSDHTMLETEAEARQEPSTETTIAAIDQRPDDVERAPIETVVTEESPDERLEAVSLRAELDDVERALARLDDGTYGTCEACGVALEDSELAVGPQVRTCVQHRG